jgi:hypothetical protein
MKKTTAAMLALVMGLMLAPRTSLANPPVCGEFNCESANNQNGNLFLSFGNHLCRDPNTGLLVGYLLFLDYAWTPTGGATHFFDVVTVRNSSDGYGEDGGPLCGPPTSCVATGIAVDGSGFSIDVRACGNNIRVFNPQGVQVYP